MKLATWNLERLPSRPRSERVSDAIGSVKADVWVLTETDRVFSPETGFASAMSGAPAEMERAREVWAAIWSRYPIEQLEPVVDPARSVAALVHPPQGRPLLVYGTVLPWVGSPWGGIPGKHSAAFLEALRAQAQDWRRLSARHPGAELCVVGDLNQDLSDRHYYGSRVGRVALRQELGASGLRALTSDGHDPIRRLTGNRASIDHICVPVASARWRDVRCEVWPQLPAPDRRLSDHYGVSVAVADQG